MLTTSHKSIQTAHSTDSHSDFLRAAYMNVEQQSARNATCGQACVRSIATSVTEAPRRYAQVAERLSRAQDSSKPPWSTAGQQHAREQVASICMPCATHLRVTTGSESFEASSSFLASSSPGLGSAPSATIRESHADHEQRGALARCKVSGRSRINAGDEEDAALRVNEG